MECKRAENLIDAYLDTELDPIHTMEVEDHLHECARCAALLDQRKALQKTLQTHLPYHCAPLILLQKTLQTPPAPGGAPPQGPRQHPPGHSQSRPLKYLTSALAAGLLLAVAALALRPSITPANTQIADAIESDHIRSVLSPEHLTDVLSTDQHTVKPWFVGKIPFAPPVVDLADQGFPLAGGRLDVLNDQTIAALVYHRKKHVINLFIYPTNENTPLRPTTTPRGYHLLHWTANNMSFWAASDVDPNDLQLFAADFQAATKQK